MRMQVLSEIDKLERDHCEGCKLREGLSAEDKARFCIKKCDIGKEVKKLGDKLLSKNDNKIKAIMAKGEDMTTSDVKYLLEKEVSRKDIAKALRIGGSEQRIFFNRILRDPNTDLSVRKPRKQVGKNKYVSKKQPNRGIDAEMSINKVEKLMHTGKSAKEISKATGLTVSTVYSYMSTIRNKKPTEAATKTKAANKAKKDKVDKMTTVEAPNKELDKLRKENKQLQERIEELKDVNGKAGDQIENLKDKLKKMTNQQQMIDELKKENESLEHDYKNVVKQQKNAEDLLNNAHKQEIEQMKEIHNEMRSQIEHKDKEIHRLYGDKQDLSNKIESLEKIIKLANDRADMFQDKYNKIVEDYRKEKQKHELLYNYVTLEKEVM